MATTEPLTGNTIYQQTDAPLGGQQAGTVVTQFAPLVTPRFSSVSARDAAFQSWVTAGNAMRDGLQCFVSGVGHQLFTSAHGWVTVYDGSSPAKQTRAWTFERVSGNPSDQFQAGAFRSLIGGTAGSAPAGAYLISVVMAMSAVSNTPGNLRLTVNNVNLSEDIKEDLATTTRGVHFSSTYVHTGGNLTVTAMFQTSATGIITTNGSRINVAYLGPQ